MAGSGEGQTRQRVLVVLAHPDDPEFFCGGTVARWVEEGSHVVYCLLTRGDKGSDEAGVDRQSLALRRESEQRRAAQVLGVEDVLFMDHEDGYLMPDQGLRKDVVRVLRQVRPDSVITCDPTNVYGQFINHADHRVAGQVTLDAVYPAARSALYFPELLEEEGLQPIKIHHLYIAGAVHPNMTIDVSQQLDRKLAALKCHESQVDDFAALKERLLRRMEDPLSPPDAPRYIEQFAYIAIR
jgi:LmbE family N-acetylglucosaminyl deacetylase